MKLLVFGETGQVARELKRAAAERRIEGTFLSRAQADFDNPPELEDVLESVDADIVIIAAAYTAVDKAEDDKAAAFRINAEAPGAIAAACAARGLPLIHLSTDFVFDGAADRPYVEVDRPNPLSVYGASKLAGEKAVLDSGARAVILRTSWVFAGHGHNFVRTMLRLGETRPALDIVADQIGGPTPARDIAETLLTVAAALQEGAKGGVYHYQGGPPASWADFARAIFDAAGMATVVNDIPTGAYPAPAQRPAYSVMNCAKIMTDFGVPAPDWRKGAVEAVRDLLMQGEGVDQ
ncbi:MAG: dTDP-4-dehydrorhamnose reductase [Parvularculaceae bacterium]